MTFGERCAACAKEARDLAEHFKRTGREKEAERRIKEALEVEAFAELDRIASAREST